MKKLLIVVGLLVVVVAVFLVLPGESVLDYQPYASADKWWGDGPRPAKEDESIRKFEITVDDEMLSDLRARLSNARYFDPVVEENKWQRGTPPQFTKDLVEYWINEYDWAAQVANLNSYEHFKTNINGLDIHFVHVKAKRDKNTQVFPIIFCHGWPGSFYEFYDLIPYLTDPSKSGYKVAFDLVIPSMPNFGFSDSSHKPDFGVPAITVICAKLMKRLGYSKYLSQGGDFGSAFARMLPVYDPEHCIGTHLNMLIAPIPWYGPFQIILASILGPGTIFAENDHNRLIPFTALLKDVIQDWGYLHIHATRPASIGHALSDSPMGIAAYFAEKFYYWTDNGGDLYSVVSKDKLITAVMIYWVNNNIADTLNYYYEIVGDLKFMDMLGKEEIKAAAGLADFKKEIKIWNRVPWLSIPFKNIVQYTYYEKGGHFAAMEQPEVFAKDMLSFAEKLAKQQRN